MDDPVRTAMKICIVCYPTHGGSGVVASELAIGLAQEGHELHIVSYAPPFRLRAFHQNIFLHEVDVTLYPLFKYPPYELGLATKLVELAETCDLDIIHAHYAIPHAASAYLAKQIFNSRRLKTVTTLHGTDITLVGAEPSFRRVVKFAIERSDGGDGGLPLSQTADDRGIRYQARDPGHSQFHRARPAGAESRRLFEAGLRPGRGEDPDARLQFPPG
jgi:glycosyltransferase involved in cell wall biosynthesis